MNIRNRKADIEKLRCNICQDFLKMVIKPNWQDKLYAIAKDAIDHIVLMKIRGKESSKERCIIRTL